MAKKNPAPNVVAKVTYAKCELFCSQPMTCPLCGVHVPAMAPHACSKPQ